MKQLQNFFSLTPYHWYLLISAMISLPIIKLSLNLLGFKKTYNKILYSSHLVNQSKTDLDCSQLSEALTVARMINIAATHGPYRANCLTRSSLLMLALKKRHIPCQLKIGANKRKNIDQHHFETHAWVESNGCVLNDRDDISTHFKAFQLPDGFLK